MSFKETNDRDAWISLRDQREMRINEITEWAKGEKVKILDKLKEKEFFDRNEGINLTWKELTQWRKEWELGKALYVVLKAKIIKDYHLSGKSVKEYIEIVLLNLGCREGYDYYKRRYWFCSID